MAGQWFKRRNPHALWFARLDPARRETRRTGSKVAVTLDQRRLRPNVPAPPGASVVLRDLNAARLRRQSVAVLRRAGELERPRGNSLIAVGVRHGRRESDELLLESASNKRRRDDPVEDRAHRRRAVFEENDFAPGDVEQPRNIHI